MKKNQKWREKRDMNEPGCYVLIFGPGNPLGFGLLSANSGKHVVWWFVYDLGNKSNMPLRFSIHNAQV